MSPILILAASLTQTDFPVPTLSSGSTWAQTVEVVIAYPEPDGFEERLVFAETIKLFRDKEEYRLERSRVLTDSMLAGQRIGVPEKPEPFALIDHFRPKAWPETEGGMDDIYSLRLARALHYAPFPSFVIPADPERRLPSAVYEAVFAKGEVKSTYREKGGLTAKGLWRFDEKGRILRARITCENAFAPGGDGTSATVTVTITAK
jgi:hypothetical protein